MKYHLYATVTGSKYLGVVEASSVDDAIKKGHTLDNTYIHVCHQCARQISDPEVTEIIAEVAE